jgi:DUF1365 family protein
VVAGSEDLAQVPRTPCLYEVTIGHSRTRPVRNAFRYRSYLWCFELDNPPELPWPLGALAAYRPLDHLDIQAELRASGVEAHRVVALTGLAVAGYVFNPISVYWCYGREGALVAKVAEVHNTYGGRHAYVLGADDSDPNRPAHQTVPKRLYVSPFYPVDGSYDISIGPLQEEVNVSVNLRRPGGDTFVAWMRAKRKPASLANVARASIRYPLAPARVRALIQLQGVKLWLRGLEVQPR